MIQDPGTIASIKQQAMRVVDANAELIRQLALDIHARPEPNYQEFFASGRAAEMLDEFGFEVEREAAGLPTAFVATARGATPGPTIGLIAEYDCVPDVGHGCGHNLICAATVAAGIGLSYVAGALPGGVKVFGAPAEEGGKGKKPMAEYGLFDDLDAALQFHPSTRAGVTEINLLAQNIFCTFIGTPAHSTAVPWEGRNALDGVINSFNAINAMRQQIHPDIRITGIVTESPSTIASIPERAGAMFRVRGFHEPMVLGVVDRVKVAIQGAALQTGTEVEIWDEAIEPSLRSNGVLTEVFARAGAEFGYTPERVPRGSGSTDLAYVGQKAPTLMFRLPTWPEGTPAHSEAAVLASKSEAALDTTLVAAKVLVGMCVDLLFDHDLLDRARSEFVAPPALASEGSAVPTEF
jgi:amidohydrolase